LLDIPQNGHSSLQAYNMLSCHVLETAEMGIHLSLWMFQPQQYTLSLTSWRIKNY